MPVPSEPQARRNDATALSCIWRGSGHLSNADEFPAQRGTQVSHRRSPSTTARGVAGARSPARRPPTVADTVYASFSHQRGLYGRQDRSAEQCGNEADRSGFVSPPGQAGAVTPGLSDRSIRSTTISPGGRSSQCRGAPTPGDALTLHRHRLNSARRHPSPAIGEQEGSGASAGGAGHVLPFSGGRSSTSEATIPFVLDPPAEPVIATATKPAF
jgi:hypothetical protein